MVARGGVGVGTGTGVGDGLARMVGWLPQHAIVASVLSAHAMEAPPLTDVNAPAGIVRSFPKFWRPQHASVASVHTAPVAVLVTAVIERAELARRRRRRAVRV